MAKELAKAYDPKSFEDRIYAEWNDKGCFRAEADPKKTPYTIVIPPRTSRDSSTWDTPSMRLCRISLSVTSE